VVAECLARPALAGRLVTNFYGREQRFHGELGRREESWRAGAENQTASKVAAIDSIAKAVHVNRPYHLPTISDGPNGCIDDTWTATSTTNAPSARANHTAVWTDSEMIVWGGFGPLNTGGRYSPITDTWAVTSTPNAPDAREFHTAVWTGNEMIVWGGSPDDINFLDTGGRYCAQSGAPTPTPTPTATATPTVTPTAIPRITPRPRPTPHPRPTPRGSQ